MAKLVFREYDQHALDAEYNNREVFGAVKRLACLHHAECSIALKRAC